MEKHACPKCNTPMDEGNMSWSGSGQSGYVSKKQTGMLRVVTKITLGARLSELRLCGDVSGSEGVEGEDWVRIEEA